MRLAGLAPLLFLTLAAAGGSPAPGPLRIIGASTGCIAGAHALPPEGPGYIVIRRRAEQLLGRAQYAARDFTARGGGPSRWAIGTSTSATFLARAAARLPGVTSRISAGWTWTSTSTRIQATPRAVADGEPDPASPRGTGIGDGRSIAILRRNGRAHPAGDGVAGARPAPRKRGDQARTLRNCHGGPQLVASCPALVGPSGAYASAFRLPAGPTALRRSGAGAAGGRMWAKSGLVVSALWRNTAAAARRWGSTGNAGRL